MVGQYSTWQQPMENNETQDVSLGGPQADLASDVAMLFSWAKVQNAAYRDFSRPPKAQRTPPVLSAEQATNSNGGVTGENNGNYAAAVTSPPSRTGPGPEQTTPVTSDPAPTHVSYPPQFLSRDVAAGSQPAKAPFLQEADSPGKGLPVVAIYSVAGGVGKTTICANLGKTLCSLREQLLLVDASGRGLLPFYFGATELKAGLRKFVAPGANAPSIQVITPDAVTKEWLDRDVKHLISGSQRIIFDVGPLCGSLLPAIFSMCSVVLVPLLPDLNSILTVAAIENLLNTSSTGSKPPVFYLFNRFDERRINDQEARDYVAWQCGHRLLPITLRHDSGLIEALNGGVSAADHSAGFELSHDFLELALWVRRVAPLSSVSLPGRWSEQ
jgi:cellulose biosynthesis protein BcsQ